MRRLLLSAVAAAISAVTWLSAAPAPSAFTAADDYTMPQAQEQSIAVTMINRPGLPPHIAVPPFVVLTADQTTQDAARVLTDVLSADLRFEREFDVMPAASYAGIPSAQTIDALPYDRWAQLGADYVALGSVKAGAAAGQFDVELRVVSVRERRQAYGAAFTSTARSARRVAHTFSDEMHKTIRGVDGVARTRIASMAQGRR